MPQLNNIHFAFQGLLLIWLLLASALSDPNTDPYSSNYNRFRQKIPRIGRRGEGIIAEYMDSDSFPHEGSLSNFFLKASKAVPRLGRRKDISTEVSAMKAIYTYHINYLIEVGIEVNILFTIDRSSAVKYLC